MSGINRGKRLIEKAPPGINLLDLPRIGRAIVSPCTSCLNDMPAPDPNLDTSNVKFDADSGAWTCPKRILRAQAKLAETGNDLETNYIHCAYDESFQAVNPIWPGSKVEGPDGEPYQNTYPVVYLAFFEDNVANDVNPSWDTKSIRCRGPFLPVSTERSWMADGRLRQNDPVVALHSYYYVDGLRYSGYFWEAASMKVCSAPVRKIDNNCGYFFRP